MSSTIFDYVSFENAGKMPNTTPVIARQFLCAFECLVLFLPEQQVREIGNALPSREQRVLFKVLQQREAVTPPTPLHKIVRKMSSGDLRAWDRMETRLEQMLEESGFGEDEINEY